jgi:hypothetical protein
MAMAMRIRVSILAAVLLAGAGQVHAQRRPKVPVAVWKRSAVGRYRHAPRNLKRGRRGRNRRIRKSRGTLQRLDKPIRQGRWREYVWVVADRAEVDAAASRVTKQLGALVKGARQGDIVSAYIDPVGLKAFVQHHYTWTGYVDEARKNGIWEDNPIPVDYDGKMIVIPDGNHRVNAAYRAGLEKVPVMIRVTRPDL